MSYDEKNPFPYLWKGIDVTHMIIQGKKKNENQSNSGHHADLNRICGQCESKEVSIGEQSGLL